MSSSEQTLDCLKEALFHIEVVRELQSSVVAGDNDRWNIVLGIEEDLKNLIKELTPKDKK
jgi:hypothetical protein